MKSFLTYFFPVLFLAVFSLPSQPDYRRTSDIKCSPEELKAAFAVDVFSVKDGDFYDNNTWSTGRVPAKTDNISIPHRLYTNNQNVYVQGLLTMRKGGIQFRGIDERNFKGSGMSSAETPNDIGLWVEGNGQLDLQGEEKESWTNLVGSAVKGSTSITVRNATNWKVGDELFVVPTGKPGDNIDWNDNTNSPIDPFIAQFERRIITQVAGNTLFFTQPLQYDHLSVSSTEAGKTWTAEVGNLTRSIVIEGTKTGRSHIFIRSTKAQTIRYVEGRFLGPRIPGYRSGSLVNGRYGLHFHHCGEGSQGSLVEGNSFHDLGNRVYVPHMSNGITFRKNIAFSILGEAFWWDFQDQSHSITYDGNLAALRIYDGNAGGTTGFELGQGDDNVCINNVAVYLHHGDIHQQGAYSWNANNVGVWKFLFNIAHSNRSNGFVWQNNDDSHIVEGFMSYNAERGFHHGAYGNGYQFIRCIFYNAIASIEATQGSTPDQWQECIFDGGGKIPHVVQILSSPIPAGLSNTFRQCTFTGYTQAATLMNTELFENEIGKKVMDYVLPSGNLSNLTSFGPKSIYNSAFRIQPVSGQSYQVTQSGRTNINSWAPTFYGKGTGLNATYYNGTNFNSVAFKRLDPQVKFIQWSYDVGGSPNEVHHKITPGIGQYSVIWDGYFQAWFTGQHQFSTQSQGGARITVDSRMLLDRWTETNNKEWWDGALINLEQGKYYKIKIEHFNSGGDRGIQVALKQGGNYTTLPISSLYPTNPSGPVEPPANRTPVVSAGADIITTDTVYKIEGSASDPDNNLASVKWTGPSQVSITQNLSDAAHAMIKVTVPGTYTLNITGRDEAGLSASDAMQFTLQPKKPVDTIVVPPVTDSLISRAGPDQSTTGTEVTFDGSKSTGKITAINWFHESGPASWNLTNQNGLITKANRLVKGTYVFRLRLRDAAGNESNDYVTAYVGSVTPPPTFINKALTDTCTNGTILTVPAGKYTASSQALADTLALQDLNVQLAKCEVPYAVFTLPDGRKLYLFGNSEPYKFIIK